MVRDGLGAGGDGGGEAVDEVDLAAAEEEPVDELEDQVPGVVHVRPGVRGGRRPTDEGRGGKENACVSYYGRPAKRWGRVVGYLGVPLRYEGYEGRGVQPYRGSKFPNENRETN